MLVTSELTRETERNQQYNQEFETYKGELCKYC